MLTKNTHRQDSPLVSTPPSSRPMAAPVPAMAAHTPRARLRSSPSVKMTVTRLRAAGAMNAPPRPWTARAATSRPEELARPPATLPITKRVTPPTNTRRLP